MNYLGWKIYIPKGEKRKELTQAILEKSCYIMNLCASINCGCATGGNGTCFETHTGTHFPIHISEGPHWSIIVTELPDYLNIEMHSTDALVPEEVADFHRYLLTFNYPTFQSASMKTPDEF